MSISLDLTLQILKKLPAKSLARFRCVSKEWKTIINDFIVKNSIVTRSSTDQPQHDAPHYIFIRWVKPGLLFLFTSPNKISEEEEQQLYLEEAFGESEKTTEIQYVHGLIGFESYDYNDDEFTIHNPTTKQSVSLRGADTGLPSYRYYLFGYDPLLNQYKVVCLTKHSCKIFTFGDLENRWRTIQCGIGSHSPLGRILCINGTIYYKARLKASQSYLLVGFDVMSELFNKVESPKEVSTQSGFSNLVNYQGKLGCIGRNNMTREDMDVWIMENVDEKQEWSKITYIGAIERMPTHLRFDVTHYGGKIVIFNPFTIMCQTVVYYYDPKLNLRTKVNIQTASSSEKEHVTDNIQTIFPVTDHVENIMCMSLI